MLKKYVPKSSIDYAITVTLPSSARKLPAEAQFIKYGPLLRKAMSEALMCSAVCELTTNYDVHYHLIANVDLNRVSNPVKYFGDVFRKDFGFTCVKPIDTYCGWIEYMRKDIETTNKVSPCIIYAVIRDDFNELSRREETDVPVLNILDISPYEDISSILIEQEDSSEEM